MSTIDFLGIGAQKAATSWLWKNLNAHQEIWMPPRKELHYFDRSLHYPSPSFLASDSILTRLFSQQEHNRLFRQKAKKELLDVYRSGDRERLKWYLKYFGSHYSDRWYESLFTGGGTRLKGEITPAYSILSIEDIKNIKTLSPDLKIILIIRDPIERAWSQVKFYATRDIFGINAMQDDIEALKGFIDSPRQSMRSDYMGMIENWSSVFGSEQMHIGFYDDIKNDPEHFLDEVYTFLGIKRVDPNRVAQAKKVVNKSNDLEMPSEIRAYLHQKYDEDIETMSKKFKKEFIRGWLK